MNTANIKRALVKGVNIAINTKWINISAIKGTRLFIGNIYEYLCI